MKPVVYVLIVTVVSIAIAGILLVSSRRETLSDAAEDPKAPVCACSQKPLPTSEREWRRLWTYPTGHTVNSTPALFGDGWVVASEDGRVEALDGYGSVRWVHSFTNITIVGSPAVAGGVVVVAGADGQAAGLDATSGKVRWQLQTGSPAMLNGPLAISTGSAWHVVLVSSEDGVLHCLAASDGRSIWRSEPTNRSDGMLAGDARHLAYGNCDSAIYVFDPQTGQQTASIPVGKEAQMAGGLAFDGERFFGGTRDGRLVAVDAKLGTVAWQAKLSAEQEFSTPVAVGDAVAMGSASGEVVLFNAETGDVRWRVPLDAEVTGMVVLDDALFVVAGGTLQGLRLKDGQQFMRHAIGDYVLGPAVNGDCVAVVDDGGNVITFGNKQHVRALMQSPSHDVTKSKHTNR